MLLVVGHEAELQAYIGATLAVSAVTLTGALCITALCFTLVHRRRADSARSTAVWLRVTVTLLLLYAIFTTTRNALWLRYFKLLNDNRQDSFRYDSGDADVIRKAANLYRAMNYTRTVESFLGNLVRIAAFVLIFHAGLDTVAIVRQEKTRNKTSNDSNSNAITKSITRLKMLRLAVLGLGAAFAALDVSYFGLSLNVNVIAHRHSKDPDRISYESYEQRFLETWRFTVAFNIVFPVLAAILLVWSAFVIVRSYRARTLPSVVIFISTLQYIIQAVYNIAFLLLWFGIGTGESVIDSQYHLYVITIILSDWPLLIITILVYTALHKKKGGLSLQSRPSERIVYA